MPSPQKSQPRILFLHTELSSYFLSTLSDLTRENVSITVVHWPINPEAPFKFESTPEGVQLINKVGLEEGKLAELIHNAQLILCSGWIDRDYVAALRDKGVSATKVLTMDNQWHGGVRQNMARLVARLTLLKYFDFIWVPGEPQAKYARKLGFDDEQIMLGYYSADVAYHNALYEKFAAEKRKRYPHSFLFVGRYVEEKGIDLLVDSFKKLKKETNCDWKLYCCGTGPLVGEYQSEGDIYHLGFVQPHEMESVVEKAGVFVLPSRFEPWGLVVHEFAAAGLPMIVSSAAGSSDIFVGDDNGWVVKPNSALELYEAMLQATQRKDDELIEMSKKSNERGGQITPSSWTEKILSLLN